MDAASNGACARCAGTGPTHPATDGIGRRTFIAQSALLAAGALLAVAGGGEIATAPTTLSPTTLRVALTRLPASGEHRQPERQRIPLSGSRRALQRERDMGRRPANEQLALLRDRVRRGGGHHHGRLTSAVPTGRM